MSSLNSLENMEIEELELKTVKSIVDPMNNKVSVDFLFPTGIAFNMNVDYMSPMDQIKKVNL